MANAAVKTTENNASVKDFLATIADDQKRTDSKALLKLMEEATGEKGKMWGGAIVGFGKYHYRSDSGREGDWFFTGFSPRKQNLTLYIMRGYANYPALMKKLGKFKTSGSCIHINRISDVDLAVLKKLISTSTIDFKKSIKEKAKVKASE